MVSAMLLWYEYTYMIQIHFNIMTYTSPSHGKSLDSHVGGMLNFPHIFWPQCVPVRSKITKIHNEKNKLVQS